MKEQILKFLRFLCGYIILSSVALLIFNGISSSKTYVYGWPSFIYLLTYVIFPEVRKRCNINRKYSFIYFTLLYFILCFLYFIFIF